MSRHGFPRRLGSAALLAGMILLLAGLYYLMVRAGIPYQDPAPEMQISYAISWGTGTTLLRLGAALSAIGGALKLIGRIIR